MKEQIMLDAFEKLLKAFSLETKTVVNEAIDLFVEKIYAIQQTRDDPIDLLPKYTRKVLIEEGQTLRAPVGYEQFKNRVMALWLPLNIN